MVDPFFRHTQAERYNYYIRNLKKKFFKEDIINVITQLRRIMNIPICFVIWIPTTTSLYYWKLHICPPKDYTPCRFEVNLSAYNVLLQLSYFRFYFYFWSGWSIERGCQSVNFDSVWERSRLGDWSITLMDWTISFSLPSASRMNCCRTSKWRVKSYFYVNLHVRKVKIV